MPLFPSLHPATRESAKGADVRHRKSRNTPQTFRWPLDTAPVLRVFPGSTQQSTQQPTVRHLQIFVLFNGPDTTATALRAAASFAADLGGEIQIAAPLIVPYPLPLDRPAANKHAFLNQITGCISHSGIQSAAIHRLLIAYSRETRAGWRALLPPGCIVVIGKPNRLSPVRRWKTWRSAEYLRSLGHEVVVA